MKQFLLAALVLLSGRIMATEITDEDILNTYKENQSYDLVNFYHGTLMLDEVRKTFESTPSDRVYSQFQEMDRTVLTLIRSLEKLGFENHFDACKGAIRTIGVKLRKRRYVEYTGNKLEKWEIISDEIIHKRIEQCRISTGYDNAILIKLNKKITDKIFDGYLDGKNEDLFDLLDRLENEIEKTLSENDSYIYKWIFSDEGHDFSTYSKSSDSILIYTRNADETFKKIHGLLKSAKIAKRAKVVLRYGHKIGPKGSKQKTITLP